MGHTQCRVCGNHFHTSHLVFENMPAAAQNFPSLNDLEHEHGDTLIIRQCAGCGLVQSTSSPVPYYRDVIRATAFSPEMAAFRLEQFQDLNRRFQFNERKIVEIGSGKGEYLTLMTQAGWNVRGLEHLDTSVSAGRSVGMNLQQGFLDHPFFELEDAPLDGFVCFNFLEHIPDLRTFLAAISNNLTADGIGLIEVPNFDLMLEKSMTTEFIADHIYYFTQETLRRTLEINGFEVLTCEVIWHNYILSAIVKKRPELSLAPFVDHEISLRNELQEFLASETIGRVAVWGAGHQALATLILGRISDRIAYVIDSAPFKQNKYTPASHLPIHGPDVLATDPVNTILIMAAAYSDEVARQIRSIHKDRFKLAILRESGLDILN